jgi:putative ABC transport system substrate-binding protein
MGLTLVVQELDGKRLQLIKETIPRLNRVAFLANPTSPYYDLTVKDIMVAAQSLGVALLTIDAREATDLDRAFAAMAQARIDSLVVQADAVLFERHQPRIIALAARHRIPVMYPWREYTDQGGLMSYSASLTDAHYRAASYVNQILKGAKPGDLPVQQPTKFDLVINLKTAKALGLTIPQSVLGRADQVIE